MACGDTLIARSSSVLDRPGVTDGILRQTNSASRSPSGPSCAVTAGRNEVHTADQRLLAAASSGSELT